MDTAEPSSQHAQDVFSLSDQVLSERLQFVEEIGFGNWGSVWLCKPKSSSGKVSEETKLAVKLVHRSKTPTTAARVRSLWNEMKIIRSFKEETHPSIIPFHSFIITPSFALITMAYLPTLIPVEVAETKCRDWFRSLLSAVRFLHKRGVVHNDIKPANILLSPERVPVLVDFGFAEKYDMNTPKAFHSNLSYGTPEYLSPERARGLPHDTRKSDVWSLGVTFFEILVGRTPFENTDGEQLSTKEDLERYWSRTMKGKWLGSWKFSKGVERLLKRMIAPNTDVRYTASEAYADPYWMRPRESESMQTLHRRGTSHNSSVTSLSSQERDLSLSSSTRSKFAEVLSPFNRSTLEKKGKPTFRVYNDSPQPVHQVRSATSLRRTVSKPDLRTRLVPKNRVQPPPTNNLSPIKASPPATPPTGKRKENTRLRPKSHYLSPLNQQSQVTRSDDSIRISRELQREHISTPNAPIRPLMDLTQLNRHLDYVVESRKKEQKADKVNQRVLEWEKEKQRLREIARLEDESEDESEEEGREMSSTRSSSFSKISTPLSMPIEDNGEPLSRPPSTPDLDKIGGLTHNFKLSLSKTVQMYKASIAQNTRSPPADAPTFDLPEEHFSSPSTHSEDGVDPDTTLPVVHNVLRNERMAAENQADRLLIWMRNVQKVVEDTRENFASCSTQALPPLPVVPPLSRPASTQPSRTGTQMSSRLPRKGLGDIFPETDNSPEDGRRAGKSLDLTICSDVSIANTTAGPDDGTMKTPSRPRRATVSTGSPHRDFLEAGSPSKRREKSRSHANLLQRHIVSPDSIRDIELNRVPERKPSKPARLSTVIDPSLFVAPTSTSRFRENLTLTPERPNTTTMTLDELTSSPCIVEPYPSRKPLGNSANTNVPESPTTQKRIEGVFDRYLMTTGVKRVGAGYQSNNKSSGPVLAYAPTNAKENNENVAYDAKAIRRRGSKLFQSTKKQNPPPSNHETLRAPHQLGHLDEHGAVNEFQTPAKDGSISVVRRAFKAITVKKLSSRA